MIYTIGHSNTSLDTLTGRLEEHEINMVLDVRSKPWSRRNPHFNRNVLEKALGKMKIHYRSCGRVFGGLEQIPVTNTEFQVWMDKLVTRGKEMNVALMCSEGKPDICHRAQKLTAYLHRLPTPVESLHIFPDSSLADSIPFEKAQPDRWLWVDFRQQTE